MLDDTDAPEKPILTPKQIDPIPVCTLMSDRSLKLEPGTQTNVLELQGLLLSAAASLATDVVRRAVTAEQMLASIKHRYDGLDPETAAAIDRVLGG